MNNLEMKMIDLLKKGRDSFGYLSVKAEFEAEGTRTDELLRLLELARKAELKIGIKIGGCEAIRDLIESKQFGADFIIAPMIESPYALKKFIDAKDKVYNEEEQQYTSFLFNLETRQSFEHKEELLDVSKNYGSGVDGAVFGRVDYTSSFSVGREKINTSTITDDVKKVAELCKEFNKDFVVGGGVSVDAIQELEKIAKIKLDRFETRKIIFGASDALKTDLESGLIHAVEFELLWLKNKCNHYSNIHSEDSNRIPMLEQRLESLKNNSNTTTLEFSSEQLKKIA